MDGIQTLGGEEPGRENAGKSGDVGEPPEKTGSATNCEKMELSAQDKHLAELLADPLDMRTQAEKAQEAGVHPATLYRRLKESDFILYVNKRTSELVPLGRPEAYRCLVKQFRKGDRAAARDYLQACGDIGSGGVNVTTNVVQAQVDPLAARIARLRTDRLQPEIE